VVLSLSETHSTAPIWISNHTRHELRAKQTGVSLVLVVPAGGASPYTWDQPHGRHKLTLSLPAAGLSFEARAQPAVISKPLLAKLRGCAHVELSVTSEPAFTRFVLREVPAGGDRLHVPPAGQSALRLGAATSVLRSAAAGGPVDAGEWTINLQVPKLPIPLHYMTRPLSLLPSTPCCNPEHPPVPYFSPPPSTAFPHP
jgi:hypothetical protein